jgi:hypothetical protein
VGRRELRLFDSGGVTQQKVAGAARRPQGFRARSWCLDDSQSILHASAIESWVRGAKPLLAHGAKVMLDERTREW